MSFLKKIGTSFKKIGGGNHTYSLYLCSCGKEKFIRDRSVNLGLTRSCGHLIKENMSRVGKLSITHGMTNSSTYKTWKSLYQRCTNSKHARYSGWGGRGITVCERWRLFENFYADMGDRPHGKTLDRIDNDGNYEPRNCKWSTPKEQAENRRTPKGEEITWSKITENQVREIRSIYASGDISMKKLGIIYDMTPGSIHLIIHKRNWKHVI